MRWLANPNWGCSHFPPRFWSSYQYHIRYQSDLSCAHYLVMLTIAPALILILLMFMMTWKVTNWILNQLKIKALPMHQFSNVKEHTKRKNTHFTSTSVFCKTHSCTLIRNWEETNKCPCHTVHLSICAHLCAQQSLNSYICYICTNQCCSRFDSVQILVLYPLGYDTIPVVDMNIVNIVINSSRQKITDCHLPQALCCDRNVNASRSSTCSSQGPTEETQGPKE